MTSPLDSHAATPRELKDRIAAERRGMPFLVYRDGDGAQVIAELAAAGERLLVGRSASVGLNLEWDHAVSRIHAELERTGDAWTIADDGLSLNGTFVNGELVEGRRRLADGDLVRIGDTILAYRSAVSGEQPPATVAALDAVPPTVSAAQQRVLVALCRPFKASAYATPASNGQIAEELVLSVDAVKRTLGRLFVAFGLEGLPQNEKRAALAARALQAGVVSRRDL